MKHLIRQKLFLASLAGLLVAAFIVSQMRPQERQDPPPAAPPQRSFERTIAGSGLIESSTENISIGTPLNGIVEEVTVRSGQQVRKGDPLFRLETRHLAAEVEVRKAAIVAAGTRVQVQKQLLADLEDQLARIKRLDAGRVVSTDEKNRVVYAHEVAAARVAEAEAELVSAQAQLQVTLTDIERSVIRAPLDATVLQVKVRPGEYAAAAVSASPLLVLGGTNPLHVRVDIDETDAPRVSPSAAATAQLRGQGGVAIPLQFVRFEPFVIPKASLTGDRTERVDTRVLQCIYRIGDSPAPLFIGQQMDVFIQESQPLARQEPPVE